MTLEHESSWQCFLKCGTQGIALFEVDDGEEVHGGSEVNHMALRLAAGNYEEVKPIFKTPASKFTGARATRAAFTSTTPMAISYNY